MHRLLANLATPNQMLAYQNFTNCWWVWRVNCAPWAPSRLSALPIIDTRVTSLHVYTSYLSSICAWRTSRFLRSCARVFTLINRHLTHLCFVLLQILLCLLAPYVPARLYSHQYLPYAPLFSLVRNTVVSVVSVVCWPPRKKTFNIVRNDHGHTQRCEFSD